VYTEVKQEEQGGKRKENIYMKVMGWVDDVVSRGRKKRKEKKKKKKRKEKVVWEN
jgi:hypothetical protein